MTRQTSLKGDLLLFAAFVATCAAIFVVVFRSGGGRLPGAGGYEVAAVVPDAVALAPGAEVREAGVRIGRVKQIAGRGATAVLLLHLAARYVPVYRDARVQVATKSLIGENYVKLDAGTPAAGAVPDGGALPLRNADESTQLDQVISTFAPKTRASLRATLRGTARGLKNRGDDLNTLLASMSGAAVDGAPVTDILSEQRRQVAGLVDDLGHVMTAVGQRGAAVQRFAPRIKATAEAVAARDGQLTLTLRALPSTLLTVKATTTTLGRFSRRADPVVGDLATALERLRPVVADLGSTARRTRSAVQTLSRFADRGRPLLSRLTRFSAATKSTVPALDTTLNQAVPALEYLAPYSREVGAFFANLRAATSYYDATGHAARIYGTYDQSTAANLDPFDHDVLDALFKLGALKPLRTKGYDGVPAPGGNEHPREFTGAYPRLMPLPPATP